MADYRVYFLDQFSGHAEYVRDFAAPDDRIAIALAEDARGRGPMELWKGSEKIKRWEAMLRLCPAASADLPPLVPRG